MSSDPTPLAATGPTAGAHGRFAVAISCIDGRVHGPLAAWAREHLGVDHLDLVTVPGSDLAVCCAEEGALERVRAHLGVSAGAHAPEVLVVSGHEGCAANPAPAAEHQEQISRAVTRAAGWLDLPVVGVWVDGDGQVSIVRRAGRRLAEAG